MGKKITVVIRSKHRQYEGLRYSLGLMFERHQVSMVVLDNEVDATDEYTENAEFIDEMDGTRLSNVDANILYHGFDRVSIQGLTDRMAGSDLVILF